MNKQSQITPNLDKETNIDHTNISRSPEIQLVDSTWQHNVVTIQ